MCGLVGFSSSNNQQYDPMKIAILLLHNSENRGKDSTGYYNLKDGLKKDVLKAAEFLTKETYKISPSTVFLGHVRQKSQGFVTIANAHPFEFDNIIGAHNGTITNKEELITIGNLNYKDYDIDSQVLFARLNKDNNPSVLSQYTGSAAAIYLNKTTPDTLYVYRDKERSLYRGITDEGMYISSEEAALKIINCRAIKEFKEQILYQITNGIVEKWMPIKPTPKLFFTKFTSWADIHISALVDKWLTTDNCRTTYPYTLDCATRYLCTAASQSKTYTNSSPEVKVINSLGVLTQSQRYNFEFSKFSSYFKKGAICMMTNDVFETDLDIKKKNPVAKKYDLVVIEEVDESLVDTQPTLINYRTKASFICSTQYFFPLTNEEYETIKTSSDLSKAPDSMKKLVYPVFGAHEVAPISEKKSLPAPNMIPVKNYSKPLIDPVVTKKVSIQTLTELPLQDLIDIAKASVSRETTTAYKPAATQLYLSDHLDEDETDMQFRGRNNTLFERAYNQEFGNEEENFFLTTKEKLDGEEPVDVEFMEVEEIREEDDDNFNITPYLETLKSCNSVLIDVDRVLRDCGQQLPHETIEEMELNPLMARVRNVQHNIIMLDPTNIQD